METVLLVGATGHIGVSAAMAALRTSRRVIAIVRNQTSANKLFENVGTKEGIVTVEADITSDKGVQSVVDKVRKGELPAFQHVYSAAGGLYPSTPLVGISTEYMRELFHVNFEPNFYAYKATIPYLLEQNHPNSTWTICTGAQGEIGQLAGPAITQGALFSLASTACRDHLHTNIRFNEVYLAWRVEIDSVASKTGMIKSSEFSSVYQQMLDRPDIRSSRVSVFGKNDLVDLRYKSKIYEYSPERGWRQE